MYHPVAVTPWREKLLRKVGEQVGDRSPRVSGQGRTRKIERNQPNLAFKVTITRLIKTGWPSHAAGGLLKRVDP
jgi:hypothetical protein